MMLRTETNRGWTEAIIDDDCGYETFYKAAAIVQNELGFPFIQQLDDFDTLYYSFDYKASRLFLFYNVYEGVTVFPCAFKEATPQDNTHVREIAQLLFHKLINLDWKPYSNGSTLGEKGSEGGTVLADFESSKGARITLEKDCGTVPFAVTLGIYGLMFHTHFESHREAAAEFIETTKFRINKLLELYDVPEGKRDDYWEKKHERQLNVLAGMEE